MSIITTPRLRLRKESDNEVIDQFATNWPIIDKFAGGLSTTPGVTPPDSELYDGAIVREGANGKAWIAVRNPISLTYSKQWLMYPWHCAASGTVNVSTGSLVGINHYNLSTVDVARSVNADSSALSGGKIILPVEGIYQAQLEARWPFGDTGPNISFSAGISLNNDTGVWNWNNDIRYRNNNVVTCLCSQMFTASIAALPFPVGCVFAQDSGGLREVQFTLDVTLISPL
jgi:hypothetical protein